MEKNPVDTKDTFVKLRVTANERLSWKLAAAPLTVSAWLRKLANDAVTVEQFERNRVEAEKREAIKLKSAPLREWSGPDWKPSPRRKRNP